MAAEEDEFYLRYYVGHKGKFGHEFLEFEFRPNGKFQYTNNFNYTNNTLIRKEVFLSPAVLKECRRIISESEILKEDYANWPGPNRVGRQELACSLPSCHGFLFSTYGYFSATLSLKRHTSNFVGSQT